MGANSEKLAELWRNGVLLRDAWFDYAEPEQIAEYEAMPIFVDALRTHTQEPDLKQMLSAISDGWANSTALLEKRCCLQEQLLDRLYDGDLIAIGYPVAPRPTGKLTAIDPDYFDTPEIDWNRSALKTRGFTYDDVRVVAESETFLRANRPKIGRPTKASEINAAIVQIAKRTPEFCKLPRKIAVQRLRAELNDAEGDKGAGDKTLEKYISKFCREE